MELDKINKNLNLYEFEDKDYVDITNLAEELDFLEAHVVDKYKMIQKRWIKKWLCTDTYVGIRVYTFNDKMFALSFQEGRKCPEHFYFKSEKKAIKIKDYISYLLKDNEVYINTFEDLDFQCILDRFNKIEKDLM